MIRGPPRSTHTNPLCPYTSLLRSTDLPYHRLSYPPLCCVIANGETVLHQVVYGNRIIGIEYLVQPDTMLNPGKFTASAATALVQQLGYGAYAIRSKRKPRNDPRQSASPDQPAEPEMEVIGIAHVRTPVIKETNV